MRNFTRPLLIVFLVTALAASKPDKNYYNETYRPQFHFSPEQNFQGEPGGLIYTEGKYHMFFQSNPTGKEQEFLHWGHAVDRKSVV